MPVDCCRNSYLLIQNLEFIYKQRIEILLNNIKLKV